MNPEPHWTAYVTALMVPLVALIAAGVALLQWRLAQNKLKLDLFDRRFRVYEAAREFLSSIMSSGRAKDDELQKLLQATREAKWLLDASLADYLDKDLYHNAVHLQTHEAELEGLPPGDERSSNVQAQRKLKEWFLAQYKVLDDRFGPYLQLRH